MMVFGLAKKTIEEINKEISSKIKAESTVVFVSGNFNVIHPGHMRFLNFAAAMGDCLVACVNSDGAPGVFINQDLRLEAVRHLKIVDYAFLLPGTLEDCLEKLRPAVVVKGKEYEETYNREAAIVQSYGGRLLFSSGEVRFSSIDLLQNELIDLNLATIKKPKDYLERHNIRINQMVNIVNSFTKLKVVVIGDLIIDEYISCDPLGMSQEDPTLVVTPIRRDVFLGGAGIVAAHAKAMGAEVSFFSIAGSDETANVAREKLKEHKVEEAYLFFDQTRRTTLKQRYRAHSKTLLRVSHLDQHSISRELIKEMLSKLEYSLIGADLLVFSDFNYGCLPQVLVTEICQLCKKLNIPMAADSQSSSQAGDISRFNDMLLVTPTEREARLAVRNPDLGLAALSQFLYDQGVAKNIFVTLGSEGLLVQSEEPGAGLVTDQLPALNHAPKDVAGAGDSMLICASMALLSGATGWEAAYLGSVAAACQVGRVGNTPLASLDIIQELNY